MNKVSDRTVQEASAAEEQFSVSIKIQNNMLQIQNGVQVNLESS
ncbi:hypothetical protein [Marinomonas sp. 2405UD68-3]